MSRDNLCVRHGGSRYIDDCTKCISETKLCEAHLSPLPCELCKPTRCLTHKQDLPCKICKEGDMPPFSSESLEDALRESAEVEKKLYARIGDLEQASATLRIQVAELRTQLASVNSTLQSVQQQVKMLGSL